MSTKRCGRCEEVKPYSEFGKNKAKEDGLSRWCSGCKRDYQREHRRRQRSSGGLTTSARTRWVSRVGALQYYGGPSPKCECCGEGRYEFLSLDHIQGDGARHRAEVGRGAVYGWLKKNGYPEGFRVLCHNCNQALAHYGYCPHHHESLGFDPPPTVAETNYRVILDCARDLWSRGEHPTYAKLMGGTGKSVSAVCRCKKKALSTGEWPCPEETRQMSNKYAPNRGLHT